MRRAANRRVMTERYHSAKPKRRRMRSMKAHIWDIQTLMNLFVVTGIMPVTRAFTTSSCAGAADSGLIPGISCTPLAVRRRDRKALLLQLGEMGILLNISRYMRH